MTQSPQQPLVDARGGLGLPELEQAVHAADPTAILIPPRMLRRVIKQHAGIAGFGLRVPHRKTYAISRDELLAIVDLAELDLAAEITLAERLILLARPTPQRIATLSTDELLLKYWRLLFHARVHLAFEQLQAEGRFDAATLARRIAQIGQAEFAEIRSVLRQEDYLLPPRDELSTYIEFAAVYLELRFFAEDLLRSYFPELRDLNRIDEVLSTDVDGPGLLAATRLAGAPDPQQHAEAVREAAERLHQRRPVRAASPRSALQYRRGMEKARLAAVRGNVVRAAVLRMQASGYVQDEDAAVARAAATADLQRLSRRLHAACGSAAADVDEWSKALAPLLEYASRGVWTREARLLYDLQKVCLDHERGVFALNLWPWLWSLGKQPLKRPLPGQRDVLMVKHLRSARSRLAAVRLTERSRRRLQHLFETAVHRTESKLRSSFRPKIDGALDQVGLVPQNLPERVARRKLVDELLDRIVERGFLTMSDLRDAPSRNNLKLPDLDLSGLAPWLSGDQLLQADFVLAGSLDSVYRRGETYLRLPQRVSSLGFGTPLGRFLTRYVVLPFGGAYLALAFVDHLLQLFHTHIMAGEVASHVTSPEPAAVWRPPFDSWPLLAGLGLLLELSIHHERFRSACFEGLWNAGRALAPGADRVAGSAAQAAAGPSGAREPLFPLAPAIPVQAGAGHGPAGGGLDPTAQPQNHAGNGGRHVHRSERAAQFAVWPQRR